MKYISLEVLLALHILAIEQFGGSDGIRDLGRLESALASQRQQVFGEELYKSIFDKAAALCRGIVGDHPFDDGNKRTAMLTALTFVEINDYHFMAEPGELENSVVQVAVEHVEIPAIALWLQTHTQAS